MVEICKLNWIFLFVKNNFSQMEEMGFPNSLIHFVNMVS